MHPVAPEEIMAFLDGELSADRAQSVSAHIEQCAGCGEIGESLRATSRKMAAWTVEAPGRLNECDILGDTGTITSRGKSNSSFSMLRRVLSPRPISCCCTRRVHRGSAQSVREAQNSIAKQCCDARTRPTVRYFALSSKTACRWWRWRRRSCGSRLARKARGGCSARVASCGGPFLECYTTR